VTAVERRRLRPEWVTTAITVLIGYADTYDKQKAALEDFARILHTSGADTAGLVDAAHDIEHARLHVISQRRSLSMAWPLTDEEEETV
jgi:hypothetical protein